MSADSFLVPDEKSGTRIDIFLTQKYQSRTRTAIRKWFNQNLVSINDHPVKASYKLRSGDRVRVDTPPETDDSVASVSPWEFALEILYEDHWILAINKPSHLIVHPGAGARRHTLVHALVHYLPAIAQVGHPQRPGVVHRLDKETSGLLLIAKNVEAYKELTSIFKSRLIRKFYRAAVYGRMETSRGRIEKGLGRDPLNRKKISIRARKLRPAVTLYNELRQLEFGSILDIEILTGRTHQIRVHLSSENHPIIGDTKYGGGNWNRIRDVDLRQRLRQSGFFGLHALAVEFNHPFTHTPLRIEAPLPALWNPLL